VNVPSCMVDDLRDRRAVEVHRALDTPDFTGKRLQGEARIGGSGQHLVQRALHDKRCSESGQNPPRL
jgi:hypothetical protein